MLHFDHRLLQKHNVVVNPGDSLAIAFENLIQLLVHAIHFVTDAGVQLFEFGPVAVDPSLEIGRDLLESVPESVADR